MDKQICPDGFEYVQKCLDPGGFLVISLNVCVLPVFYLRSRKDFFSRLRRKGAVYFCSKDQSRTIQKIQFNLKINGLIRKEFRSYHDNFYPPL